MIVAGLRFDTSMTPGNGPGWSKTHALDPGELQGPPPEGPLAATHPRRTNALSRRPLRSGGPSASRAG